jgi:hypothetical protein
MTVSTTLNDQRGFMRIGITGVASTANAGIGQVINPEGVRLGIIRSYAYFVTGSTGAANLGVGVGVSGAAGSDILSAFDVIEATVGGKLFYCQAVPVNETEEAVIWEVGEYVTFTGSATTVGLEGDLYLEYIRLA